MRIRQSNHKQQAYIRIISVLEVALEAALTTNDSITSIDRLMGSLPIVSRRPILIHEKDARKFKQFPVKRGILRISLDYLRLIRQTPSLINEGKSFAPEASTLAELSHLRYAGITNDLSEISQPYIHTYPSLPT